MSHQLAHMTWEEARDAFARDPLVIVPVGSIEAHGPHLPLDVDTHQAGEVARRLAERVDALVAPTIPYGYASTWMNFPGSFTLSADTFQQVVYEIGTSLTVHGVRKIMILNAHRPNGTAVDVAARRIVDDAPEDMEIQVTALSYWEPGAAAIHALRRSKVGGMGHACEFETSFQLATRPDLVKMDRLAGVHAPLVGWDLVGPSEPARTYNHWPAPGASHPAIFGDPAVASAESGERFLKATIDALVQFVDGLQSGAAGTYAQRKDGDN
jgi:creatinine amidohydrolase